MATTITVSPGDRFARLTVLAKAPPGHRGVSRWHCVCDCGARRTIRQANLKNGNTKSCGCLWHDTMVDLKTTHGKSASKEFSSWLNMRSRCSNPNHKDYRLYGGRGIAICDRWNDFALFLKDMGPKPSPQHSIDRIDFNGDYEPSNCRWATPAQQCRNRRPVELVRIGEQSKCLTEWCEIYGVNYWTVRGRIKQGATLMQALTHPTFSHSDAALIQSGKMTTPWPLKGRTTATQ